MYRLIDGSLCIKTIYSKVEDMMKQILISVMVSMLLAGGPIHVTEAQERPPQRRNSQDQDRAYKATKAAGLLPYSRIRRIAEAGVGGKIISQKLVRTNVDNWIYQLRIRKKDGRVTFAVVNAKTGKILSVK